MSQLGMLGHLSLLLFDCILFFEFVEHPKSVSTIEESSATDRSDSYQRDSSPIIEAGFDDIDLMFDYIDWRTARLAW